MYFGRKKKTRLYFHITDTSVLREKVFFATVFYNNDVTVGSHLNIYLFYLFIYSGVFFVFADELAVVNQG